MRLVVGGIRKWFDTFTPNISLTKYVLNNDIVLGSFDNGFTIEREVPYMNLPYNIIGQHEIVVTMEGRTQFGTSLREDCARHAVGLVRTEKDEVRFGTDSGSSPLTSFLP